MTHPVIQINNLGKRYVLGGQKRLDQTLPEAIAERCRAILKPGSAKREAPGAFWALRDINFNVNAGEVVGIVGANGAGKSTLLKILSQITDPTEGDVTITGRVGSLLEVGTGFHPELTGRENIFLNGAVLGMTRREIKAQFDEIVDFSGVERFLDTPVKRYSSGMTVRLAFAVAAHLDPEILIVDEVLAVGDAAFQEKCLGKMKSVAGANGRTVLFVSHNMAAVAALCDRGIMLQDGHVIADGPAQTVVDQYLGKLSTSTSAAYVCDTPPNAPAWFAAADIRTSEGTPAGSFAMTESIAVHADLDVKCDANLSMSVQIQELNHNPVAHYHTVDSRISIPATPGRHSVVAILPPLHLYPGQYLLLLTLTDSAGARYTTIHQPKPLRIEIRQDGSLVSRPLTRQAGLIFHHCDWRIEHRNQAAA